MPKPLCLGTKITLGYQSHFVWGTKTTFWGDTKTTLYVWIIKTTSFGVPKLLWSGYQNHFVRGTKTTIGYQNNFVLWTKTTLYDVQNGKLFYERCAMRLRAVTSELTRILDDDVQTCSDQRHCMVCSFICYSKYFRISMHFVFNCLVFS